MPVTKIPGRTAFLSSILFIFFVTCICPLSALEYDNIRDETGTAGWIEAGRVIHLSNAGRSTHVFPPEALSTYNSAKLLKALLCDGDTLWIGTEGGLYAYCTSLDSVFSVSGPAVGSITSLEFDDSGTLWVGGDKGVSIRRSGRWFHYLSGDYGFFELVTGIHDGGNKMWVMTYGNGCGYLESDSLTILSRADSLLDDRVMVLIEKSNSEIYFGTASGLCMADSFSWRSMRYGYKIPIGQIDEMILDEEGNLFLAVARQGIVRLNLGRVRKYGRRQGLPGLEINAFSLDPTGRVWAAGRSGISMYDGSGWVPLRIAGYSFAGYNFLSIRYDVDGICYLGTDEGRLLILSMGSVKVIEIPQAFPISRVSLVKEFNGVMWFNSGSEIFRYREDFVNIPLPDSWYKGALTGFANDHSGVLWVSTRFGILRFNGGAWQVFDRRLGLPANHFTWVSTGSGGDLWFGTFNSGILKLSLDGWTHYSERNGLPSNRIIGLVTDGEGIPWILSESGRIARFVSDKWESIKLSYQRRKRSVGDKQGSLLQLDPSIRFVGEGKEPQSGVLSSKGLCIGIDASGNCLFCRSDGIFKYSENGWQVIDIPYTGKMIVPLSILGSRRGELWLGTAGEGLFIRRSGKWINLKTANGISGDHVLSICEDEMGRIWAGTGWGGVTVLNDTR